MQSAWALDLENVENLPIRAILRYCPSGSADIWMNYCQYIFEILESKFPVILEVCQLALPVLFVFFFSVSDFFRSSDSLIKSSRN